MLVHDSYLWIGNEKVEINGALIQKITGLHNEGPNPSTEFVGKIDDIQLAQIVKSRFGLTKGSRGFLTKGLKE